MLGQRRSPSLVQCRSIVFDAGPTLKQNWVIVPVCSDCHTWDALPPERLLPSTPIHWPNCKIMLGHRLRRWANIISTKTLLAPHHDNREYLFSEYFLNTKLLNLRNSNVKYSYVDTDCCTERQPFPGYPKTSSQVPKFPSSEIPQKS